MNRQAKIDKLINALNGAKQDERSGIIDVDFVYLDGKFHILKYEDNTERCTTGEGIRIFLYEGINLTDEDITSVNEKFERINIEELYKQKGIVSNSNELLIKMDEFKKQASATGIHSGKYTITTHCKGKKQT